MSSWNRCSSGQACRQKSLVMMTVERNQDGELTWWIPPHKKASRVACMLPKAREGQAQAFHRGGLITGPCLRGARVTTRLWCTCMDVKHSFAQIFQHSRVTISYRRPTSDDLVIFSLIWCGAHNRRCDLIHSPLEHPSPTKLKYENNNQRA